MTFLLMLVLAGRAAADPQAGLSSAESRAAAAAAEVGELKIDVRPAESRFESATRRAAPIESRSAAATGQVATLKTQLRRKQLRAVAAVNKATAQSGDAAAKHEETVRTGIGFGLSALIVALIALAWGWFRASIAVAYLARIPSAQAVGLCVGGGIVMLLVGGALANADGVAGVIGVVLIGLGLMLPIALLLARHSAEVQRGRARPWLRRERMPRTLTQVLAGILAALFLVGIGTAVFAGEAQSSAVSTQVRREAAHAQTSTPALANAGKRARTLEARAGALLAVAGHRRTDLRAARRKLAHAQSRLASANSDAHHFTHQLVALETQETHEAEEEEREREALEEKEQQQFEKEEREAAKAAQVGEEEHAAECDSNYSGCLDPNSPDYDCEGGEGDGPDYTGTVEVRGYDQFDLDRDGDGIGCDD